VEGGWFLGDKAFKEELLAQDAPSARGPLWTRTTRSRPVARRAPTEGQLGKRRWTEADLSRRRKGDPEKVQVASQLRAQTTMMLKWTGQRLKMGAWTHVSNCLVQQCKTQGSVNSSIVMTDP
jgi:hypothetical protein